MEIAGKTIALMLFAFMGASYYCFCKGISRDVLEIILNGKIDGKGGEAIDKRGDNECDIAGACRFFYRCTGNSRRANGSRTENKENAGSCPACHE